MALLQSAGELVIRLSLPTDKEAGLVLDLFWQVTISGFAKKPWFFARDSQFYDRLSKT